MSVSKSFEESQLAEASYANFSAKDGRPSSAQVKDGLILADFSERQADWVIQENITLFHRPNTASGFSATVFQAAGGSGEVGLTLAIRGTEPFSQLGVDLVAADLGGVVLEGAALYQIVDLYNYWKQLTASSGATVRLARISETSDPVASGLFAAVTIPGMETSFRRVEFFDQANAGLGIVTGPVSNLTVTGHSLGGHLATAFQRLFPSVVGEVFTVNGAGTRGSAMLDRFFDALAGRAGTSFNPAIITNLYGSAGPNVVSGELVYTQIGSRGEIYTESVMDVGGHGSKQMTDSTAVYDLFIRVDDRLKLQTASQLSASLLGLFKAADAESGYTLEAVVNALGRLFLPGYTPISRALADDRDGLHSRIIAIRDVLPGAASDLSIASLAGKSADELTVLAGTDIAYRYALRDLNPFAVLGADYAVHNVGGSLDSFDAATGRGLTAEWVAARSRMLSALADYNTADGAVNANAIGAHFEDRAREITFGPLGSTTARIVFGRDDQALVVAGSAAGDRLFGAAADDSLTGNAGDDYLEGGRGADRLDGGAGDDRLVGGAGDDVLVAGGGTDTLEGNGGFDTYYAEDGAGSVLIRDTDGSGQVFFADTLVTGGVKQSGNDYRSADGTLALSFIGDADASGTLIIGGNVRVEHFHNGDLGITLEESDDAESPVAAYAYSRYTFPDNAVFDPEDPAVAVLFSGSHANDVFAPGAVDLANPAIGKDPDREDAISAFGEHYRGWGGNDVYHGSYHYSDIFHGDGGDDAIYGGDLGSAYVPFDGAIDADTLYGGGGRDTIVGGKGDDALYGDFRSSALRVFTAAGRPNSEAYGGSDPVELADLFTLSLDDWTAAWSPAQYVSSEGRWDSPEGGIFDDAEGQGFEAALRYYLGLDYDTDIVGFYDDHVSGGRGNDRIFGGFGSDTLFGDEGDDIMEGDAAGIRLEVLPEALRSLFGRAGDDYIDGGEGDDFLRDHLGGNDVLLGGAGDDTLYNADPFADPDEGESPGYANYLSGGEGNDTLTSFNDSVAGFDHVDGGDGDDTIAVSSRYVEVFGGTGDDIVNVSSPNGYVDGGAGNDTIGVEYEDYDVEAGEQNETGNIFVFGGTGDDAISAVGPVDIDGGAGDDVINWSSAYAQTVGGFINGGADDDDITAVGPVNIDAGSGDDEIHVTATSGRITTGSGADRITIGAYEGVASDIVLDADAVDELIFAGMPVDGTPPTGLQMQRAGNDLQLSLVGVIDGEAGGVQASVRIEDWFAGSANQLASISVEGLRSWTPAEVASLIAEAALVAEPGDSPEPPADPGESTTPVASIPSASASASPVLPSPDLMLAEPPVILPARVPATNGLLAAPGVLALARGDQEDTTEAGGDDPVAVFLEQIAGQREADFSFSATQTRVEISDVKTSADAPRADQIANQWSALHAYMDTLAAESDADQTYAARTDRLFGQMGLTGISGSGLLGSGVADASPLGLRDLSPGDLRPLQGLSEGFSRLG